MSRMLRAASITTTLVFVIACGSTATQTARHTTADREAVNADVDHVTPIAHPATPAPSVRGPQETPRVRWRIVTGDRVLAPAMEVTDGGFVVGSVDGHVYRVTRDGVPVYRTQLGSSVRAAVLVLPGDSVVVGTEDGALFWLDARGDAVRREQLVGSIVTAPLRAPDGSIYVAAAGLYAFDADGTLRFRRVEATTLYEPVRLTGDGHISYRTPNQRTITLDRTGELISDTPAGPVVPADLGVVDTAGTRFEVVARDTVQGRHRDGRILWSYAVGAVVDAPLILSTSGTLLISAHDGTLYALK